MPILNISNETSRSLHGRKSSMHLSGVIAQHRTHITDTIGREYVTRVCVLYVTTRRGCVHLMYSVFFYYSLKLDNFYVFSKFAAPIVFVIQAYRV